jgi:uncharacterized protein (TIGR02147 family)
MEIQTPLPMLENQLVEPQLSTYTDFREYLRNYYDFKVNQSSNSFSQYNYKNFSASADIKSPNYLKLIIEGERNLSDATAKKFAKAIGLTKEESDEFLLLVQYGQALDPLERNSRLKALNAFRVRRKIKSGEINATDDSSSHWVKYVLHAIADQKNVDFSIDGLREHMMGKVTADDIRKNLQQLFDAKALQLDNETGNVKKGNAAPAQDDMSPEMIRKIQSELMYLGMEALLNGSPAEREIGTVTVALTEAEFEKLKFELRHLRKRIYKDALIARSQAPGDRVYQLNIQLFPITKKGKPGAH